MESLSLSGRAALAAVEWFDGGLNLHCEQDKLKSEICLRKNILQLRGTSPFSRGAQTLYNMCVILSWRARRAADLVGADKEPLACMVKRGWWSVMEITFSARGMRRICLTRAALNECSSDIECILCMRMHPSCAHRCALRTLSPRSYVMGGREEKNAAKWKSRAEKFSFTRLVYYIKLKSRAERSLQLKSHQNVPYILSKEPLVLIAITKWHVRPVRIETWGFFTNSTTFWHFSAQSSFKFNIIIYLVIIS